MDSVSEEEDQKYVFRRTLSYGKGKTFPFSDIYGNLALDGPQEGTVLTE